MTMGIKALCLFFFLTACVTTEDNPSRNGQEPSTSEVVQARYMDPGDPNRDPNWDWTVSGPGHTMYFSTNGAMPTQLNHVQLPFFTAGHPLNTDEKDMYPEDGWMLAFRDFGTPTNAPAMPFIALYNKYRGTLRIMFYNAPNIAYSFYRVEIAFRNTAYSGGLFTFTDPEKSTLADYDRAKTESFMSRTTQFLGWIYADFTVFGYDPGLHPDAKLRINVSGIDQSKITLASTEFTLTEMADNAAPAASNPLSFSNLLGAFNKGQKFYKSVADVKKSLRSAIKEPGTPWWEATATALIGSAAASAAPWLGGLVGFVTSFIGGKNKASPGEPLSFEGSLQLSGSIELTQAILATDFALAPGATAPDFYRPVQAIPWGVLNLSAQPKVLIYPWQNYCHEDGYGTVFSCIRDIEFRLAAIPLLLNPEAGVTIKSVKAAFTNYSDSPTPFVDPATTATYFYEDVEYYPYYYVRGMWGQWPKAVALEIELEAVAPTRYADRETVVYKIYPASWEWQ
jgi:hypothetical protein